MDNKTGIVETIKGLPSGFVAELKRINWSKARFDWTQAISLLAYLNILVVVPMMFAKKSLFVEYHARQGMVLLVVWVLFGFSFFLPVLPVIFGFYLAIAIVVGWTNVIMHKHRPLPIIGNLV